MNIGELSRRCGIPASSIRYYERIGLLPRAVRVSGRRTFDEDSVQRLTVIQAATETGFSLTEVRELLSGSSSRRWIAGVERKMDEIDASVARLRAVKRLLQEALRCGCVDITSCARFLA